MARAWLADAALVVLDEPEAGLDMNGQSELAAALARLREGRTLVLLTHSAALLAEANHVVRLVDGRRC
jgi:ATP-binding cassette subfamily C protein CydD